MEKQCNVCKQVKGINEFNTNGTSKKGTITYRPACKQCTNEKNRVKPEDRKQLSKKITDDPVYKKAKQMADSARSRIYSASKQYKTCYQDLETPFGFESAKEMKNYILENFYDDIKIQLENEQRPSIDRIKSTIGYTPGNLRVIPFEDNTLLGVETRKRQVLMLTPPSEIDGIRELVLFDSVIQCGHEFGITNSSETSKISDWISQKGNYKSPDNYSFLYYDSNKGFNLESNSITNIE